MKKKVKSRVGRKLFLGTFDGFLPTSVSWTGPVSGAVSVTYNSDFLPVTQTVGGSTIGMAYDLDGLLIQSGDLAITRSTQNNLITGSALGGVSDSWTHNSFGEPTNYRAKYSTSTIFNIDYTRDIGGRITQKTETIGGTTLTYVYGYDNAGRLSSVSKNGTVIAAYVFDSNSNRLTHATLSGTRSGAYDAQDRLTAYGDFTYTYTANGEMKTKTSASGEVTGYEFDVFGNLKKVTLPGGDVIEYLVDGQNRRVARKVNGTIDRAWLYQSDLQPVAELDSSGAVISRFVYGTKPNIPDYMVRGGVTYRMVSDHLGSPRLIVNTVDGTVAQRIDFDEFGVVIQDTNPGFTPFGFGGGFYEPRTGLTRFGAREFSADVGRWIQRDPILFGGGDTNLMSYVAQDPVNAFDSSGLARCSYSVSGHTMTCKINGSDAGFQLGPAGVIQEMIKSTVDRIMKAEQEHLLGYPANEKSESKSTNSRNGYSKKTLKSSVGDVEIDIPRDRDGSFEPQIVPPYEKSDRTLEEQITGMYARGMSVRDIHSQLESFYGVEVSPALISKITDKVLEGIVEWQSRPLEDVYPVLFLDAIHYKIRVDSKVVSKAAYTVLGIDLHGRVDVLGLWLSETEGAHFWLTVLTELKKRGVKDVLIACVDGLKGFPEAIEPVFPKTQIQLCVVHQIRSSLRYVGARYPKEFMADLKEGYRAPSREAAEAAVDRLETKWADRARTAVNGWRGFWRHLSTFFDFPEEVRRMIYTTNSVEALHQHFRKVTKTKGAFPTDEALKKMLYLATLDLKGAFRNKRDWPVILGALKIVFGERISE